MSTLREVWARLHMRKHGYKVIAWNAYCANCHHLFSTHIRGESYQAEDTHVLKNPCPCGCKNFIEDTKPPQVIEPEEPIST